MPQRARVKAHERHKQALELALAGRDYQTIADQLGFNSRQAAWKAVKSAIDRVINPAAEAVRQLELQRIDRLWLAVWEKALAGNLYAVDRALKIMERRAYLQGLDAPQKFAQTDTQGRDVEPARERFLTALQAMKTRAEVPDGHGTTITRE